MRHLWQRALQLLNDRLRIFPPPEQTPAAAKQRQRRGAAEKAADTRQIGEILEKWRASLPG
jgi:hypothetical protein